MVLICKISNQRISIFDALSSHHFHKAITLCVLLLEPQENLNFNIKFDLLELTHIKFF